MNRMTSDTCPFNYTVSNGKKFHAVDCHFESTDRCATCGWYPEEAERRKAKLLKGEKPDVLPRR